MAVIDLICYGTILAQRETIRESPFSVTLKDLPDSEARKKATAAMGGVIELFNEQNEADLDLNDAPVAFNGSWARWRTLIHDVLYGETMGYMDVLTNGPYVYYVVVEVPEDCFVDMRESILLVLDTFTVHGQTIPNAIKIGRAHV